MSSNTTDLPKKYTTDMRGTFGWETARKRWPTIVSNCEDTVSSESRPGKEDVLARLRELKIAITENKSLEPFSPEEEALGVPKSFNEILAALGEQRWQSGEWLFCEIYLYKWIVVQLRKTPGWEDYDIFEKVKRDTFKQSESAVVELAQWYRRLHEKGFSGMGAEALKLLFWEMVEVSLWGNATDLSLLTNASLEDIQALQGESARRCGRSRILVDNTNDAWELLSGLKSKGARVDFVLDNAGFELYADLIFVIFLLETGLASACVLHAKDAPYMVSDTMVKDLGQLLSDLEDPRIFAVQGEGSGAAREALNFVLGRVREALADGRLSIRDHAFWTEGSDYWELVPGHPVYEDLRGSDLVIFKGDLNYRKMVADRVWPRTTPWATALGALARHGLRTLSLRTCKADVVAGLPAGVEEELCAEWKRLGHENGELWCSSGRWAVICYCDGEVN